MLPELESYRIYHKYRSEELHRKGEQERLANLVRSTHPIRFYYPALAGVGRWLVAYGLALHRRYGDHHEHPEMSSQHTHLYPEGVES